MAKNPQPKKIKMSELVQGLRVVVNDLTDAYLYTVEEVQGLRARLSYYAGEEAIDAGWMDYSYLHHPTSQQYEHAFAELARAFGIEYDYTPGGRVAGVIVPFHIMLDAPKGKLFKGTLIHCDGGIQGNDNETRANWKRCYLELDKIIAEGFVTCDDADCEICHPDEE